MHGLSWLFLLLTALLLPRVWREDPGEKPAKRRWLLRLGYTAGLAPGVPATPRAATRCTPWPARMRWPHLVFWTLVTLVAVNVYWIAVGSRQNPNRPGFHQNFAYALIFTNRVWITVMACHFFLEARRSGALELFLTSPLPVRTLLRGHGRALRQYFFWPIFAIGLLHVLFVWANWTQTAGARRAGIQLPAVLHRVGDEQLRELPDRRAGAVLCGGVAERVAAQAGLGVAADVRQRDPGAVGDRPLPAAVRAARCPRACWPGCRACPGCSKVAAGRLLGLPLGRMLAWVTKNLLFVAWARWQLHRHFRRAAAQTRNRPGAGVAPLRGSVAAGAPPGRLPARRGVRPRGAVTRAAPALPTRPRARVRNEAVREAVRVGMRFLPIVERELRVAARRRSAFWVRVGAAGTAVVVGALPAVVRRRLERRGGPGAAVVRGADGLAFAFCVAAGPLLTADTLSEEKREGTLGFLFLTDLRPHDVVLGKLAAASVAAVFSLLAVLPVVALSLLLGGVTLAEFGRVVLVLLNSPLVFPGGRHADVGAVSARPAAPSR